MKVMFSLLRRAFVALPMVFALGAMTDANAQEPIRVGSFLSITGPASFLGEPELKTIQLYVEKINAEGGVLGRKLELIHYDDGGDANKANSFVKRLIESDKVDIIVGGTTTGTTMASVPLIEKAEIPFVSIAGGIVVVEPVKKWVFKTPGSDRHSIERLMVDMKAKGITKVALMIESTGLGQSSKVEAYKVAPNYGITFPIEEAYNQKRRGHDPAAYPHSQHAGRAGGCGVRFRRRTGDCHAQLQSAWNQAAALSHAWRRVAGVHQADGGCERRRDAVVAGPAGGR